MLERLPSSSLLRGRFSHNRRALYSRGWVGGGRGDHDIGGRFVIVFVLRRSFFRVLRASLSSPFTHPATADFWGDRRVLSSRGWIGGGRDVHDVVGYLVVVGFVFFVLRRSFFPVVALV